MKQSGEAIQQKKRTRPRADGEVFIWLAGAALGISILLVFALSVIIMANALGFFWAHDVAKVTLHSGQDIVGEIHREEQIVGVKGGESIDRIKIKRGNRELFGDDFIWIPRRHIERIRFPSEATVIERLEWGDFYGTVVALEVGGGARVPNPSPEAVEELLREVVEVRERIKLLEVRKMGGVSERKSALRAKLQRAHTDGAPEDVVHRLESERARLAELYRQYDLEREQLQNQISSALVVETGEKQQVAIPFATITRVYQPNLMGWWQKAALYFNKLTDFLTENPREANMEGGVFPAIFGTVMLVLLMSIVVTPLGVLAAIYLREYAKQGLVVSIIRIGVNNLAGVPSIVFGVFGLGFFIYFVGGTIDELFFAETLPNPTFGTGGILWASLTLALLTLPTVIVATEEGLASIPQHWREASYALGATRLETLLRVVLPALTPSILTGVILAIARAAGEVAPLMITGVVKLAPSLPWDSQFPYLHLDRKFMHLGFHIYDLGFQSPNVDASRPMVFVTTLLLLCIVVCLNAVAIWIRAKLRARHLVQQV